MQPTGSEISNNALEDQWAFVLELYQNHPVKAMILAQDFQAIRDALEAGPRGVRQVIQSMDEAIETLSPFSEFYEAGRDLFFLAVKGTLRPAFDIKKFAEQARSDAES